MDTNKKLWKVEKGPTIIFVEAASPSEAAQKQLTDEDVLKTSGVSVRVSPAFRVYAVVRAVEPGLAELGEGLIDSIDEQEGYCNGWCKVVWNDRGHRWIPQNKLIPIR